MTMSTAHSCTCSIPAASHLDAITLAYEHRAPLHKIRPIRERAIDQEVDNYCWQGVRLRRLPAQLPIRIEEYACYRDCRVAECEPHIRVCMILDEFEGAQVVWKRIVARAFQIGYRVW